MISFIITFNKHGSYNSLLQSLSKQVNKAKKLEFIFVVPISESKTIKLIENFKNNHPNNKIKILFSNKNLTFINQIAVALKYIENDYFMVINSLVNLKNSFISSISRVLKKNEDQNLDVIEFNLNVKSSFELSPSIRLSHELNKKIIKVENDPKVIAFAFPIIYNKIISKKLIQKIDWVNKGKSKNLSSALSIFINYKFLLNAKKYCFIDERLINIELLNENIILFNDINNEWKEVINLYRENQNYLNEIKYAKYFYLKVVSPFLINRFKKSFIKNLLHIPHKSLEDIQKKYIENLKKIESQDFQEFLNENIYMNIAKKENEFFIIKKTLTISNWDNVLNLIKSNYEKK